MGAAGPSRGARPCACACAEREDDAAVAADTCAIIVAGGSGERFGDPRGKQFVDLVGLPLMSWAVMAFDRAPSVARIVIVCAPDRAAQVEKDVLSRLSLAKPVALAPSGETRQESVRHGLEATPRDLPLVAVHDAARPLIEVEQIEDACAAVRADESLAGAILATRSVDTLKLVEGTTIVATPDRSFYWAAQTPQVFRRSAWWSPRATTSKSRCPRTSPSPRLRSSGGCSLDLSSGDGQDPALGQLAEKGARQELATDLGCRLGLPLLARRQGRGRTC